MTWQRPIKAEIRVIKHVKLHESLTKRALHKFEIPLSMDEEHFDSATERGWLAQNGNYISMTEAGLELIEQWGK